MRKSSVWTYRDSARVCGYMDDPTLHDPDLVDLVVQLCTRIGMIMEDVGPLALVASPEGLEDRVHEIASAIRILVAVAHAAQVLLEP